MPSRPASPCTWPAGCPALVEHGSRCPDHTPPGWQSSTRRSRLPGNWNRTRARILRRDRWRCYLCHRPGNRVDHVIPNAEGGTDADDNLACICLECDKAKSAREGQRGRQRARLTR